MFIDSHAHLTCDTLFPYVDALLQRAAEAGIHTLINICTNQTTLERGLELSKRYPWVYNAAATTPHDVESEGESFFPFVQENIPNLIAIGETGLDYYYEHSPRDLQKKYLRQYLQLSINTNLPIIIHCREAFSDFFEIIDSDYANRPGLLHCFTGTMQEAEELLKRGWYLSFSGIITFKKSLELLEVAKHTPLNQILIETDAPYLAPQSKRGKTNEPAYLTETAQVIANAKKISLEELTQATTKNTRTLFKL